MTTLERHAIVAHDDEGAEVFRGTLEYADGGMFGIRTGPGDEDVTEWPAELCRVSTAARAFVCGCWTEERAA